MKLRLTVFCLLAPLRLADGPRRAAQVGANRGAGGPQALREHAVPVHAFTRC
jgi:hypothetical protein